MKKKKIIKAQLGRMVKDTLSPQQRMQLDTYKKTVVDERANKESERMDQEQKDFYRKRFEEYQAQPKYRAEPMPSIGEEMEEPRRERMPSPQMEELSRMLMQEKENAAAEAAAQGATEGVGEAVGRKKGGKINTHKMPGGKIMKDSDMKKKKKMGGGMMQDSMGYKKGGTVRGGRSEIKGTRPAKLY